MIDFEIKSSAQKRGGLYLGFSPGPYRPELSLGDAIWVTEDAFAFLEPSILLHCPRYRNFGHWGVTPLDADEWAPIIDGWTESEEMPVETMTLEAFTKTLHIRDATVAEISAEFSIYRDGVGRMLRALVAWLRLALISSNEVFILGI